MSPLFRASTLLLLLGAVASCDMLKKKISGEAADAESDAAVVADVPDSAPPPAVGPVAANEDDVARFPGDTKPDTAATIQRPANAREVPLVGDIVAQLAKGTAVTQIAEREKAVLVTFDNPKAPGTKLMGWVTAEAFVPVSNVDAGVKPLTCTAPDVALFSDSPFCGRPCKADTECPTGQVCKGSASTLKNGKAGDAVTVCSALVAHDAGAPAATVDGGSGVVTPFGKLKGMMLLDASAPAAAADAGAASNDPDVVSSRGKTCPPGFHHVKQDGLCHRLCPTLTACKQAATKNCVGCGAGISVCSATRDLCQ